MNAVIIPAYQPDHQLKRLTDELFAMRFRDLVVVDDGSKAECAGLFEQLERDGCHVVRHAVNQGKGAAIKTGIRYALDHLAPGNGFVTCDADGQHRADDIRKVSEALDADPDALILGSRDFSGKDVPRKSRWGNRFSSFYFKLTTGIACRDTQTGLRGIPTALTELALAIPENRYDYEMTFLTRVAKAARPIVAVPIATVYLNDNASSHFRPFTDSIIIYKKPIKFALSSILSAVVDLGIFSILSAVIDDELFTLVFIATVAARVVSGVLNFLLNRRWSFRNDGPIKRQFLRYFVLYVAQLVLSIVFVSLLAFLPVHLTIVKMIVDGLLFVGSFFIQKNWVFRHPESAA